MLFHQLPAVHGDAVRSQRLVYAQPVLPRPAIPLVLLVCWKGDEGMHKIAAQRVVGTGTVQRIKAEMVVGV